VTRDAIGTDSNYPEAIGNFWCQPFFLALMARALIEDYEQGNDGDMSATEVLAIAQGIADFMWQNCRDPDAFYTGFWLRNWAAPEDVFNLPAAWGDATAAAYDLGQYFPALYAWVALKTNDASYMDKADALFVGGVLGAYQASPKQFNQQYYWSLDYLLWRQQFYGG
jgi:hypothetical protein